MVVSTESCPVVSSRIFVIYHTWVQWSWPVIACDIGIEQETENHQLPYFTFFENNVEEIRENSRCSLKQPAFPITGLLTYPSA